MSEAFLWFWGIARKGSRKRAWIAWKKAGLDSIAAELVDAYQAQNERKQVRRAAGLWSPDFQDTERWIRNERWDDALEPVPTIEEVAKHVRRTIEGCPPDIAYERARTWLREKGVA
jgi:hypothetical protein